MYLSNAQSFVVGLVFISTSLEILIKQMHLFIECLLINEALNIVTHIYLLWCATINIEKCNCRNIGYCAKITRKTIAKHNKLCNVRTVF